MRTFACGRCGQLVFFENTACLHCGAGLGFAWPERELRTLLPPAPTPPYCANAHLAGCNWLVTAEGELCAACALTTTRPADDDPAGLEAFRTAEGAKRWLLFGLGELGLPLEGLLFDLLSSTHEPVMTGHAGGLVTLDLAESEDARREQRRAELDEPYRTVLGHLRHEVGHFYFTVLVSDDDTARARELFGDATADYQAALDRHYADGPPDDWPQRFVSAYATMHPDEDWAETFKHYLHLRDTLQTAGAYRLRVLGPEASAEQLTSFPRTHAASFDALIDDWLPLTYAANALNRSMGQGDLYPFVLAEPVLDKLAFVHDLVSRRAPRSP